MTELRTTTAAGGAEIDIDGVRYVNFGGSSYLGLSANPEVLQAGIDSLRASGSGYQFPREFGFVTRAHRDAETEAGRFFGSEAALYMAAGYYFGLIALAASRDKFSSLFFDELAHYSLREAIAASELPSYSFRHLDADDLRVKLRAHLRAGDRPLVVTDGMYSTVGEIAPLATFFEAVAPYEGRLLVDESHSFGVLGPLGRGAAEHHGLPPGAVLIGGSTGKAFGVIGGIIPATASEVAAFCTTRAVRGGSAGLPAAASMCARSLRYVREHPEIRERLRENTIYMKAGLRRLGLSIPDNVAPVASFTTSDAESTRRLREALMKERIHVFNSKYVGAGAAGVIRCGIFADHTREHMDRLFDALRRLL